MSLESLNTVVTIPENLPLSDTETSVLSKGLKFVPMSKKLDDFSIEQDVEKFLCHVKLNVFFHDKEGNSNTSNKDIFETLHLTKNSKWTPPPPPEGQFTSLDIFINKCHHDSNKLNFNHKERIPLEKLSKHRDNCQSGQQRWRFGCLAARPLPKQSLQQLSDTSFYA